MKPYKFSFAAMVLAVSTGATAQMQRINQLDVTGIIDGHEYVDLGLSVKWATRNIGAENAISCYDYHGDYFSWGEVETKKSYDSNTCTTTEHKNRWGYGQPSDVAAVKWGSSWRMPTDGEYQELIDSCTWKDAVWIFPDSSRIWGSYITGPNGNSIFLPSATFRAAEKDWTVGNYYWTAASANVILSNIVGDWCELDPTGSNAGAIKTGTEEPKLCIIPRFYGLPVRAVSTALTSNDLTPATDTIDGHGYVDLGLSVMWATCNLGADKPEDYGDYFAWGDTEPKLKYYYENSTTIKSTCNYRDAAMANWGKSWRVPTHEEFEELNNCQWLECSIDGKKGYKITGPNGNCIFLPAAGLAAGSHIDKPGDQYFYWSSSTYDDDGVGPANITDFDADGKPIMPKDNTFYDNDNDYYHEDAIAFSSDSFKDIIRRSYGLSIRPVARLKSTTKQKKRKK